MLNAQQCYTSTDIDGDSKGLPKIKDLENKVEKVQYNNTLSSQQDQIMPSYDTREKEEIKQFQSTPVLGRNSLIQRNTYNCQNWY
jgi:hypothetical protein